jgi:hypothetical protein
MQQYAKQVKDSVNWAEKITKKILSGVPDLPKNGQKWLAENVWWLVALGAIVTVISVINSISYIIDIYSAANSLINSLTTVRYTYGGWWTTVFVIGLALHLGVAVLLAKAVMPLKNRHPKGWRLLFFTLLFGFAAAIIPPVLGFYAPYIVTMLAASLLGVLVGAYFLHQIKPYFSSPAKAKSKSK